MQCARGYYESGKRVHLFNMLKYALSISIAVVFMAAGPTYIPSSPSTATTILRSLRSSAQSS